MPINPPYGLSHHVRTQIRRVLLEAFVEPKRVIAHDEVLRVADITFGYEQFEPEFTAAERSLATARELREDFEPQPEFVRCTIVHEGNVPNGNYDASIRLTQAIEAEARASGMSNATLLRTLAAVLLRAAAMHDDSDGR